MKKLLITALAFFPLIAVAEYDVERIKQEMLNNESLEINGWKNTEVGTVWMAEHDLPNTVISAGEKETGILRAVTDEWGVILAMSNCRVLGDIGLGEQAGDQVKAAQIKLLETQEKQILKMDGLKYSIQLLPFGDAIAYSCLLQTAD